MRNRTARFPIVVTVLLVIPAAVRAEDAASHVASARAHLEKREYDKAIADCNKALGLDFNSAEAYNIRACGWIGKAGCDDTNNAYDAWLVDCAKALDDCDEALRINSEFADAYVSRACAWICKRVLKKAIADCDKALSLDPKSARAYCTRAHASVFTGDNDRNIADSNKALEIDANLAEAYNNRATGWLGKGDYGKALADCGKALAIDPSLEEAHVTSGLVWSYRSDQEKAIAEYKRALELTPNEWRALNDLGVAHWQIAQLQERKAAAAEAAGDVNAAKACREKSDALKKEARNYWMRGVTARPTAADIHSNLGYAYTDAASRAATSEQTSQNLDRAEFHLRRAVACEPKASRPHNNLGRVILRRSQKFDADARAAEAKGRSDPAEAEKADTLRNAAREKRDAAIEQFEKAVELEPSLLEARLNLGEVYTQLKDYDKAEAHYRAIQKCEETQENEAKDWDSLANFSHAHFGLAQIAFARGKSDEGIAALKKAIEVNPNNMMAIDRLAQELFLRGNYGDGEQVIRKWLVKLARPARRQLAEQFGKRFEGNGKHEKAVRAWDMMAWIFAASPEPQLRDPQAALGIADGIVKMTKQEDPLALDTLAAALAANDKFPPAVKAAQQAIDLANKQGNKPLAEAIAKRLKLYKQEKPYRSDGDDSGRP